MSEPVHPVGIGDYGLVRCTGELRWLQPRFGEPRLQQAWETTGAKQRIEWRDVPVVTDGAA